jgi:hypothetical protein
VEWASESVMAGSREIGVSLALDKPQTGNSPWHRLGDANIDLVVSHERDKWIRSSAGARRRRAALVERAQSLNKYVDVTSVKEPGGSQA